MKQFLDLYTTSPIIPCGNPPRDACIRLSGAATRPVVYIDGFRVFEPPPPDTFRLRERRDRGAPAGPPPPDEPISLEVLDAFSPRDFYKVEYFVCPGGVRSEPNPAFSGATPVVGYVEIHAYTYEYMERLARRPGVPLPSCLP